MKVVYKPQLPMPAAAFFVKGGKVTFSRPLDEELEKAITTAWNIGENEAGGMWIENGNLWMMQFYDPGTNGIDEGFVVLHDSGLGIYSITQFNETFQQLWETSKDGETSIQINQEKLLNIQNNKVSTSSEK
jgi:hypothetical protein